MECPKRHRIHWSVFRAISSPQFARTLFPRFLLILAISSLLGAFLQACGGGGGGASATNIKTITIDPVNSSIAVGTKVQLHATANFKNKTTKDVTASVTWESADEGVVIVSNEVAIKGLAGGKGAGATSVRAKLHGITGFSAFTVTETSLKSITVEPVNPQVSKGTTVQMTALGNFSDGSVQDLTSQASWSSGNSSIAQVSNTDPIGLVTGVSAGSTPITATFNGIHGSTTVTVLAATVTSITITPPDSSIADGTTTQETATCNLSDGTTEDCTSEVDWTSGNNGIAQVSDAISSKGLVTGVAVGSTTINVALGGVQGSTTLTVTAATLVSLTITPPDPSIAKGTTTQLTATGNFSDGTTQDCTIQVSWTSGDNSIAQVSNISGTQGLVTGLAIGSTTINVTLGAIQASTTLTVTKATLVSLTITPPDRSIADGTSAQLTATGNFSDGTTEDLTTQVNWTSGNNAIALVSNAAGTQGLVTGVAVGSTAITVILGGVQGSTTLTVTAATLVSLTITPPDSSTPKGTSTQLTATGNFSDGTTQDCTIQVSWTSGNNTIAQVSNATGTQGLVTGVAVGSTTITVTLGAIQASTTFTVTAATLTSIVVTPPNPSVAKGLHFVQLTATGTFSDGTTEDLTGQAHWTSSASSTVLVFNGSLNGGLVVGLTVGSATISASFNGIKGSTTVTVTAATLVAIVIEPPNRSIANGTSLQLTAVGIFSDLTTLNLTPSVSWTSGDNTIAQVSNTLGTKGVVTGLAVGKTPITATLGGISGSTTVTVTAATLISIQIVPPVSSLAKGTTEQLTATGTFSDGTTQDFTNQVNWTSADNTIAQVSDAAGSKGLVTGINLGLTTINVTLNGLPVGSAIVKVSAAILQSITIGPPNPSIAKGTTVQLTATGNFSDGTTQNFTSQVSWTSADTTIAVVSNASGTRGLVTGQGLGNTPITATLNGLSGSTTVTVTAATLVSIAVTPINPTIANGTTVQLAATGTFTDGTTQDLTQSVSWTSAPLTVAQVSPSGLVSATSVGSATITARQGGVSGSTTVTVTAATLTSIAVTPANPSIATGTAVLLTATCTFSDSSTADCTSQVSWTSGNTAIAQVSNISGTQGVVAGLAVGTTAITATLNGISGSTNLTVTGATLTSIIVTPANPIVPVGTKLLMTATAVFSDGTMQDVTLEANWTSSDDNVVHIQSTGSPNTNGRLMAKQPGTATITATIPTLGNAQGSTVVTVTS